MSGLVTFALIEAGTRMLTRALPENGMPAFGGVPLVPYRPTAERVRAALDVIAAGDAAYVAPDRELGWTVRPGGLSGDGRYEANAQGARAPRGRRYAREPAVGRVRVVTVGDSFTHGDQVSGEETWQREMERMREDLEVVNFGVPGYGTDQALLRWRRDGAALRAHQVVLGIWPENVCRNLNVVRYFLQPAGGFLSKPRFVQEGGALRLLNVPVLGGDALVEALSAPERSALLRYDYWALADDLRPRAWHRLRLARVVATIGNLYRRRALRDRLYRGEDPSGIELTLAIAQTFQREVIRAGAAPLVLLLPMRDLLERWSEEDSLPLARALRRGGLDVVDLGPVAARVAQERGEAFLFQADGHLTPEGNRLVARTLVDALGPRSAATRQRSGSRGRRARAAQAGRRSGGSDTLRPSRARRRRSALASQVSPGGSGATVAGRDATRDLLR